MKLNTILSKVSLFFLLVQCDGADALRAAADDSAEPELVSIFPLGGSQGSLVHIEIRGRNLEGTYATWSDIPGLKARIQEIEPIALQEKNAVGLFNQTNKNPSGERVNLQLEVSSSAPYGSYSFRLVTPAGVSNPLRFLVNPGSLASILETSSPHSTASGAQQVGIPVMVDGKINEKGEVDYFAFEVRSGQQLTFKVTSNIMGLYPKFDVAELTLYEPSGSWFDSNQLTQLALHANPPSLMEDPVGGLSRVPDDRLTYTFMKSGRHLLKVGTNLGIGGPDSFYRLLIAPSGHPALVEDSNRAGRAVWQERLFDRVLGPERIEELWARSVRTIKNEDAAGVKAGSRAGSVIDRTTGNGDTGVESSESQVSLVRDQEPNETVPQPLNVPALITGAIDPSGDMDRFRFKVTAGQMLAFEIETPGVKPFDFIPSLVILDWNGNEVLTNHFRRIKGQNWFLTIEPKTVHSFAQGGEHTLQIRNINPRYGNAQFSYRVLVRRQIPHIGKTEIKEDRLNLVPGEAKKVTVVTDREEGFSSDIMLELDDLPSGVQWYPAVEPEPERKGSYEGGQGNQEQFRAKSQRAAILVMASEDAIATRLPQLVRVLARPITKGKLGDPLLVGEIPVMVVKPAGALKETN